jgi:hypothetical protein
MYQYPDYADGGADGLRSRAASTNRIGLRALSAYTPGADYAAIVAATIGRVSLVPGDITSQPGASGARDQVLVAKTVPISVDAPGDALWWAITDDIASRPQLVGPGSVAPEDRPLEAGGSLVGPSFVFASHKQPT